MRDTLSSLLQAATATILLSLLIENTAIWLMNNPIVIPTETCIILSPNENEPRYADSAVVFEEYAERSPPSRPNADCKPQFSRQSATANEGSGERIQWVGDKHGGEVEVKQMGTERGWWREKKVTHGNQEHQTRNGTCIRPAP